MNISPAKILAPVVLATLSALGLHAQDNILSIKEIIKDSNIVYPESFEANTDEMLKNWYLQNYTVLDTKVENRDAGTVSDSEYIRRLKAIPSEIEMPYNSVVHSYINMYAQKRRTLVETMLGMSLYYMPIFEQALEKYGLPLELRYLPVIESALNPNAVSKAGAAGLWQFMVPTAKGLGLNVNTLVDERRDPYRASDAAARFLKELYGAYGDWSLAIAAYNCGPGNVNKALRRAGGGKKDFWEIYAFLPAETRGYVPAFIAANYIMTYYNKHNISPAVARHPLITDTVVVNKRLNLNQIAGVLALPVEEIRILNPHFRKDVIPGDAHPCTLTLPTHQIAAFIMSEDSITAYNAKVYAQRGVVEPKTNISDFDDMKLVVKYHKVRKGETLKSIANKYGVTTSSIQKANKMRNSKVSAGKTLKINTYQRVAKPKPAPQEVEKTVEVADSTSTVAESQESSDGVAEVTVEDMESDAEVSEPEAAPAPKKETPKTSKSSSASKSSPQFKTHKVTKGESLGKIARKYPRVTIADIKKANNLTSDKINIGQKLKIPVK